MANELPVVAGWDITRDGRCWKAVRQGAINPIHLEYGCRPVITASSYGALELELCAEKIKTSMIDAAYRLLVRLAEADAERAAEPRP